MLKIFGMTIKDLIQIIILVFALGGTWYQFKLLVESTDYLLGFSLRSDNYHSAITGQVFKQGAPLDSDAIEKIKKAI